MKWSIFALGDILSLEYGAALPGKNRDVNGKVPVAGSNGVAGYHSQALVKGPGIIIGRKGSAGKVNWFDTDFWAIDTTFYVRLKAPANMRWIFYLLKQLKLDRLAIITGVPGLSRNDAYCLKVPLPPLSEQHRIVEILEQADALRKKRAEADAKAERILPALFTKMFGDPATNPLGWKILQLEQVSKRITDGTHQPPQFVHEGIPFLFVQNIVNGYIDFNTQKYITEDTYAELTKIVKPESNDILYSTVGSYGVAVRVDADRKFSFQRHIAIIKLDHSQIDPWFLCAQLNMPHVKAQADQRVRGIAQKTLNLSELKQFCILVPPLAKQKQFTQLMTVTSNMLQAAQRQSHLLNYSFELLLHRAFSGALTAKWRETHMTELLAEMEQQAKILGTAV